MEWVDAQVKKYLNKERQFSRKLMVCMHITGEHLTKEVACIEASSLHRSLLYIGGQPTYRPELGSIKIGNSIYLAQSI
jgi:hypothetical protein